MAGQPVLKATPAVVAIRLREKQFLYFEPGYIDEGYFDERGAVRLVVVIEPMRHLAAKVELKYP